MKNIKSASPTAQDEANTDLAGSTQSSQHGSQQGNNRVQHQNSTAWQSLEEERLQDQEQQQQYFYQELKRLHNIGFHLLIQRRAYIGQKQKMIKRVEAIEHQLAYPDEEPKQTCNGKKRGRREAAEIPRRFQCRAQNCGKQYGLEGSLTQHMRLKHPDIYEGKN